MPDLIKLYIRHVAIGFGIAALFVAILLWFDVMGLWHLISTSDVGLVALVVLWFAHGIVFAGVQFAWAVMALAHRPSGGGGTRISVLRPLQPVPIPQRSRDGNTDRRPDGV